jgi:hypothetical protein
MSKRKAAPRRRPGREIKHGAYSIVYRDEIVKQYPELARYTQDCHAALLKDQAPGGPATLSAAKQIVLDGLSSKLQTWGLLNIFLGTHGIIRRDRLDQRILECEPAVATLLQVWHSIRMDLQLLGIEKVEIQPTVMTVEELTLAVRKEQAEMTEQAARDKEGVAGGPGVAQDRRSDGGEGQDMGEGQGGEG